MDSVGTSNDPGDDTLAAYRSSAAAYLEHSGRPAPEVVAYLARFAELTRPGPVFEIGSGPGWDAEHLEQAGVRVVRSDAPGVRRAASRRRP